MKRSCQGALIWCAAAAIAAPSLARAAGLTDQVAPADARVATAGAVSVETVGDRVGGHDTRRPAWVVGANGSLTFPLRVTPGVPLTLEFQEIYGRDVDVRAYSVAVDGVDVYFRTFRGCGAGPVHFFVQLPAQAKDRIEVRLTNRHDVPFAISRAWSFASLPEYVRDSGMAVPYRIAPTVRTTGDFDADLAKLETIKRGLAANPAAHPAWTTWLPYANLSYHDARRRIDYVLQLAEAAQMPVQISFDSWWANAPSGSDGRGGYWNDVAYQQVSYDNTNRRFHLSIPNRWSSTPWQTMNHAAMNAYRVDHLERATAYLRERAGAMRAGGAFDPVLAVNLDNEPVYWASGNAALGNSEIFADFNAVTVADAVRDGVTLDPVDGLSRGEREWLFGNILRYVTSTGDAAAAGLRGEATIVDGANARPPADPLVGNIYTQAYVADPTLQFPLADATQGLWETGAPAGVRVGGEYNGNTQLEAEAIAHHVALGRSAAVNAEAGNKAHEVDAVLPGYAFGLRYWTPYNYPIDQIETAAAELADLGKPLPATTYERNILAHDFASDGWRSKVVEQRDAAVVMLGNTLARVLAPTAADRPGLVVYRLDADRGRPFEGLTLEFSGRAFVSGKKDASVHIRVLAGESADAMQEARRIFDSGDVNEVRRVDLSDVARGKSTVFVRIELHAPNLATEVLSWCSLRRVAFTVPWPAERTRGLPGQDRSVQTLRAQHLVVSWRADAELAIEQLGKRLAADTAGWQAEAPSSPPSRLAAARAAYDAGRYAEAYRAAAEGTAMTLPARFEVRAAGALGPYPLRVDAAAPVRADLHAWDDVHVRLSLQATGDAAVPAKLTFTNQPPGQRYVQQAADGAIELRRAADGPLVADAAGRLVVDATAAAPPADVPPTEIVGPVHAYDAKLARLNVAQSNGDGIAGAMIDPATVLTLTDHGTPDATPRAIEPREILRGDHVTVRLDVDGVAREARVERRTVRGRIREVRQLSTTQMAAIWLDGDEAEHVIELFAPLQLPGGDKFVRAEQPGTLKLAAGDEVRVRLNPVTGRIAELWK